MKWTTDRAIAAVALVIGVPGFLALFLTDRWVQGVLVLCLVLAILAWWVTQVWRDRQPLFTLQHLEKRLTIHDEEGRRASFARQQTVRANHLGTTEWWCRNLAGDGPMSNVLIDGMPPDEVETVGGTIQVCRRFHDPLQRGQIWESTLTYDLENSFTRKREELIHYTAFKTGTLILLVVTASMYERGSQAYIWR